MKTLVVNFFAGSGSGKSTLCNATFAWLKRQNINCEIAAEYAKGKVWEESYKVLNDQIYVFGKQYHILSRLLDKVDVILTDSPLIMSNIYYRGDLLYFKPLVLESHWEFNNLNFFVKRKEKYNPAGRLQTEKESKILDKVIKKYLYKNGIAITQVSSNINEEVKIGKKIIKMLNDER